MVYQCIQCEQDFQYGREVLLSENDWTNRKLNKWKDFKQISIHHIMIAKMKINVTET